MVKEIHLFIKAALFFGLLYAGLAQPLYSQSYGDIWGEDYDIASSFVAANCNSFQRIASENQLGTEEAMAVVFPELIRYSLVRDLLETSVVELGYVKYGAGFTDFSIGQFQMKPSFIEGMEEYVCANEELRNYTPLFSYSSAEPASIRSERITRLKREEYQFQYLSCFMSIARLEYPELICMPAIERVKLMATLYNAGFGHSLVKLQRLSAAKVFPYGSAFGNKQYSYAEVSKDFFLDYSLLN